MPQHPPLYYESMAVALRTIRVLHGGDPYPTIAIEVLLLRLLNVLLVAPLPLLTWLIAREVGATDRLALASPALLLAVPQLTHIVGSVNNDNLLTVLGAALTWLGLRVVRRPGRWQRDLAVGLVLGAALLTKAFAFVLVPWVALAYVIAARRHRAHLRSARGLAIAGGVAACTSGWFWIRNLQRYGQIAPTTFFERAALHPHDPGTDHLGWLGQFARLLPERFWGSMGRYAARLPGSVVAIATAAVLACVVAALVDRRRGAERDRAARAMAVLPTLLLGAYVAQHAHHIYVVTGWYSFIQGRYLFAGVAGLMAVVALGADVLVRGRFRPIHALAFALAMQGLAGFVLLQQVWGGDGVTLPLSVTTMVVWSPLPGPLVVLVGLITVIVAATTFRTLTRRVETRAEAGVVARAPTAFDS
jgi:hypothetical protein